MKVMTSAITVQRAISCHYTGLLPGASTARENAEPVPFQQYRQLPHVIGHEISKGYLWLIFDDGLSFNEARQLIAELEARYTRRF